MRKEQLLKGNASSAALSKEALLKGNASSAAFDVVNALGGIAPDPGVSLNLKGKTVSTITISEDLHKGDLHNINIADV